MRCKKAIKNVIISNGLFFFERCNCNGLCQKKIITRKRTFYNLYAHAVAIMRLHFSKKNSPLLKKTKLPSHFTDISVPKEFQKKKSANTIGDKNQIRGSDA